MKTDTPRTDSKSSDHIGFWSCATVPSDFARTLERENAELIADMVTHETALSAAMDREDELRGKLAGMEEQLAASQMLYDMASKEREALAAENQKLKDEIEKVCQQRDAWAAKCDRTHIERTEAENARLKDERENWRMSSVCRALKEENARLKDIASRLQKIASAFLGWHSDELPVEAFREITAAVIDANEILKNASPEGEG
jgi:chromosome segregation ATPase